MEFIVKQLQKAARPFNTEELKRIRYQITVEMKAKGFSFYVSHMNDLVQHIQTMLRANTDSDILNDDYWTEEVKFFEKDVPWWSRESPALAQDTFRTIRWGATTGLGKIISTAVSDDSIDSFIGKADWMTPPQVLVFKAAIGSYFTNHEKLWPIFLNIDLAYQQWERDSGSETSDDSTGDIFRSRRKKMLRRVARIQRKYGKSALDAEALVVAQAGLAGSGPFILKILQQLNSSNNAKLKNGTPVKALTERIFDQVPSMTTEEYELVKSTIDIPAVYKQNLKSKVLGSASIAEAHYSKGEFGEKVVVKFLKPIYGYYFLCECDFLLTVTWKKIRVLAEKEFKHDVTLRNRMIKQARQLLMFLVREFVSEFDYQQESNYTLAGFEVYNKPQHGVLSAQMLNYTVYPFPAIVQTYAKDKTIEKILKKMKALDKHEQQKVLSVLYPPITRLLDVWFKNLFFGNGFFHADAHPGNLMAPDIPGILQAFREKSDINIYLIDYGSSGKLTKSQRCLALDSMLISSEFQDYRHMLPIQKEKADARTETYFVDVEPQSIVGTHFPHSYLEKLTDDEQKSLIETMKDPEMMKIHSVNLKTSKKFIEAIWKVCNINSKYRNHKDGLYKKILQYHWWLDFGTMFLSIARHAVDIGECTFNNTLMFGRGVAYLGNMVLQLHTLCDDETVCKRWDISQAVKSQLLTLGHASKLVKYYKTGSTC